MWKVWDKKTPINSMAADAFLARNKHLENCSVIFIREANGKVVEVQGKEVLASVYGIDATLPDAEFIEAYTKATTAQAIEAV